MYHFVREPKCSKCGSTNSETFQRRNATGRRCLVCGHEHTEPRQKQNTGDSVMWKNDREETF